jgi:hypothetical protein
MLLQIEQDIDVKNLSLESPKLGVLYQGIYRKGLVSDVGKLTLTGKELIKFVTEEQKPDAKIKRKATTPTSDFEKWWKAYPGTDTFVYEGKSFTGTRSLRTKKDDCKAKFAKILEEGEYTVQDMIEALEFEVLQKKNNSIKDKTNKLTFMQNSLTYLNQRTFEPFIELIKAGIKIVEPPKSTGGTDI